MKKNFIPIMCLSILFITGCTPKMLGLPTSEKQLLTEGHTNTVVADTDVISAYANLKTYMEKCVVYSSNTGYVGVKANLDRDIPEGSFLAYGNRNVHMYKIHLTPTSDGGTKIDYTFRNLWGNDSSLDKLMQKYKYIAEHTPSNAKPCKGKD